MGHSQAHWLRSPLAPKFDPPSPSPPPPPAVAVIFPATPAQQSGRGLPHPLARAHGARYSSHHHLCPPPSPPPAVVPTYHDYCHHHHTSQPTAATSTPHA